MMPCYPVDNETYLSVFLQFAVPATQARMVSQIRLHNIRLFEFGLAAAFKSMPKTFIAQRNLWTLLTACLAASGNFK